MDQEKIGLFIKQLRSDGKMTQAELAKKLNVTDRAVSKWERGKGIPDISLLEDLSKIFDVSILEILRGEKLEKETIKEANILDMLKYAKEDKKNFIKRIVNIVCLVIILLTGFSLGVKNIKSIYYQNKSYRLSYYMDYSYNLSDYYQEINKNIKLIRNNQGKYSDEDYEYILEMIDKFEKGMNYDLDREILDKKSFKVKELVDYANKQIDTFQSDELDDLFIILLAYDSSIFKNIKYINDMFIRHDEYMPLLYMNNDVYYYDFKKMESYVSNVAALRASICSRYNTIYFTLTYVIKVGDIHE